jgi:hypothetical protein
MTKIGHCNVDHAFFVGGGAGIIDAVIQKQKVSAQHPK